MKKVKRYSTFTMKIFSSILIVLSINSCELDLIKEQDIIFRLEKLPVPLHESADSLEVVVQYGGKSKVLFQGNKRSPGFEGPYESRANDYAEEVLVYIISQFDAEQKLIQKNSFNYSVNDKKITHTITLQSVGNGVVEPEGIISVDYQGSLTITAHPDKNHYFKKWRVDGNVLLPDSLSPSIKISKITDNAVITAHFGLNAYKIGMEVVGKGIVIPGTDTVVEYEKTLDIKAEPDSSHYFSNWSVTGNLVLADSTANSTQVLTVKDSGIITAHFKIKTYQVKYLSGPNGKIGDKDSIIQIVEHGGAVNPVTATPSPGFVFTSWSGDSSTSTNPITVANVSSNLVFTAGFSDNTYSLTVKAGENGTVRDNKTEFVENVPKGSSSSAIIATPKAGYKFIGWTGGITSTDNPLILENLSSDLTITANFAVHMAEYKVTFIAESNGKIGLKDTLVQTVAHGEDCSPVTANPSAGFLFTSWKGDNISSDNPLTVSNVTSDMIIMARFSDKTYQLKFIAGKNGKVGNDQIEVLQNVNEGDSSAPVTATPSEGYRFAGWTGDITSTDTPLIIGNIKKNLSVTANFEIRSFTVTFDAGDHGLIDGQKTLTQTVVYGGDCSPVTVTPSDSYNFDQWNGGRTSSDNPITVTGVQSALTITASYSKKSYSVTFKAGDNGLIGNDQTTLTHNVSHGDDSPKVPANPSAGHKFLNWTGAITSTDNPLSIKNVTSDMEVTANFQIESFVVTFNAGDHGMIGDQKSVTQTVPFGGDCLPVTATPSIGFDFEKWTGGRTSSDNPMTVTNVQSALIITATYSRKSYDVTFKAGANGKIDGDKTTVVHNVSHGGNSPAVPANPSTGYHFVDWTGAAFASSDSLLIVENVTADFEVTANFEINQYKVKFIAGENGTVGGLPSITQTKNHGESCAPVTASGNSHYHFIGWTGSVTSDVATLTISYVDEPMEVTANFAIDTHTVSFNSYAGSPVTAQKAAYNSTISKPPDPMRTGYLFEGWYKEEAYENEWNFSSDRVVEDVILHAKWNFAFIDIRDGKVYKKVVIGSQTWMAENLNYVQGSGDICPPNPDNKCFSWCYDNQESNCGIYGRLYDWPTANANYGNGQDICPSGWHLPSRSDYTTLIVQLGGSAVAGGKMKSATRWDGTDGDTFAALPAGYCHDDGSIFVDLNDQSRFWTSDIEGVIEDLLGYELLLATGDPSASDYYEYMEHGQSVRCIKD